MKDVIVAGRYATALFMITEKRGETAAALADLRAAGEALAPRSPAGRFFASPGVRFADKRAMLQQALGKRALQVVVVFLDLLLRKKRFADLPAVVEAFEALVEKAQGIQRAQVVSAVPLTGVELDRLQEELERYTRTRIKLASAVEPELLGGALVRIGDHVIDGSVRARLESIARQLREIPV